MSAAAQSASPQPRQWLSRRAWMWVLIGVAFSAAAIFAASRWLEVVDETEWVGVKGEAATNPYLALERLLVVKGATTLSAAKSSELDQHLKRADVGVLLLGANRVAAMTPERVAMVAAWVEQGGHLIVEAERPGLGDPLLSRWAIERKPLVWRGGKYVESGRGRTPLPSPNDPADTANPDGAEAEEGTPQDFVVQPRDKRPSPLTAGQYMSPQAASARIRLADGTVFNAIFYAYQNITPIVSVVPSGSGDVPRDSTTIARDRLGGRIAEISAGRGRVTAISNLDFVQWKELGKADHAELIWHLLATTKTDSAPAVLLMLRPTSVGLAGWLLEHAWMVLSTACVLLCVWIWHVLPRFGPLLPPVLTARRSLREHMRAAGGWFASRSDWAALVTPVRARFWARLARRHPRTTLMPQYDRLEYVGRLCHLTFNETTRLLTAEVSARRECLYVIRWLMRLTVRLDGESRAAKQNRQYGQKTVTTPSQSQSQSQS